MIIYKNKSLKLDENRSFKNKTAFYLILFSSVVLYMHRDGVP